MYEFENYPEIKNENIKNIKFKYIDSFDKDESSNSIIIKENSDYNKRKLFYLRFISFLYLIFMIIYIIVIIPELIIN